MTRNSQSLIFIQLATIVALLFACTHPVRLAIGEVRSDGYDFTVAVVNRTANDVTVVSDPLFMPSAKGNKLRFSLWKSGKMISQCAFVDSFKRKEPVVIASGKSTIFEYSDVQIRTSHCIRDLSGVSLRMDYFLGNSLISNQLPVEVTERIK